MNEHAIAISIRQNGSDFIMTMKVVGKLKHSDYELLVPLMDKSIDGIKEPKIKILVDILEFEGYELRALWDDFKFGLKYNKEFSKIAVVGNKKWEEIGINMANWFMHADTKYFEELENANKWLSED